MVHVGCVCIAPRTPFGFLSFSFKGLLHWCTTECKKAIALSDSAPQSAKRRQMASKPPKSRFLTAMAPRNLDRCKSPAKLGEGTPNSARRQPVHCLMSTTAGPRHSHFGAMDGGGPSLWEPPGSRTKNKSLRESRTSFISVVSAVYSFSIGPNTLRNNR